MNTAQNLATSKPDRDKVHMPKARGGWTFLLLLVAAAVYFYLHPNAVNDTFSIVKEWVLSQQKDIFSKGGGYGELPKTDR